MKEKWISLRWSQDINCSIEWQYCAKTKDVKCIQRFDDGSTTTRITKDIEELPMDLQDLIDE
jgi:hypothetical protein